MAFSGGRRGLVGLLGQGFGQGFGHGFGHGRRGTQIGRRIEVLGALHRAKMVSAVPDANR